MMKKIGCFLCTLLCFAALLPSPAAALEEARQSDSLIQRFSGAPQLGDQETADVVWSRTTEPGGAKEVRVASWLWSDVAGIDFDRTEDVWDGGTIGDYYIEDARRPWDIATWSTGRAKWTDFAADARRFRGEFTIPEGFNVKDNIMITSVGDYHSLGLHNIIPINDNIYVFIYPKGQVINDDNFMEYFAFWTGTASQEAAQAVNGGEPITFHGILGTAPLDYKTITGNPIPKENLLSHTDGWYCEATQDNVGYVIENHEETRDFVIDLIVEDFAGDGGMDRLDLVFTKTTLTEPEDPLGPEPEDTEEPESTPEPETTGEPEDPLGPEPEPEDPQEPDSQPETEKNPETGRADSVLLFASLCAVPSAILCVCAIRRKKERKES